MGDGDADSVTLSGDAAGWVRSRARERGVPPDEYAQRLVAAFRTVETAELVDLATTEDVADVERRLEALDRDLDEKIDDVRSRVVQVKREADGKADADHDHPELADDVEDALDAAREAERMAEDAAATAVDVEDRLDAGFENYEDILETLRDRTNGLSRKVGTLARVLVDVRDSLKPLVEAANRRNAVEKLKRSANREGIRSARCEECDATVDVALLTRPACPFCEATVTDVEPKSGFFGSPTLATGTRPALEAPQVIDDPAGELEDIADE